MKPLDLHFTPDFEPEFEEMQPLFGDHLLESRSFAQEYLGLFGRTESHDGLDNRPVVPGAVEQSDFPTGRQIAHIALEVPKPRLPVGWFGQRYGACIARIEVFEKPFDRAALAGGVAPFEQS